MESEPMALAGATPSGIAVAAVRLSVTKILRRLMFPLSDQIGCRSVSGRAASEAVCSLIPVPSLLMRAQMLFLRAQLARRRRRGRGSGSEVTTARPAVSRQRYGDAAWRRSAASADTHGTVGAAVVAIAHRDQETNEICSNT